jgi:hypothetical protein
MDTVTTAARRTYGSVAYYTDLIGLLRMGMSARQG